jgi:hypothetical protein
VNTTDRGHEYRKTHDPGFAFWMDIRALSAFIGGREAALTTRKPQENAEYKYRTCTN